MRRLLTTGGGFLKKLPGEHRVENQSKDEPIAHSFFQRSGEKFLNREKMLRTEVNELDDDELFVDKF